MSKHVFKSKQTYFFKRNDAQYHTLRTRLDSARSFLNAFIDIFELSEINFTKLFW